MLYGELDGTLSLSEAFDDDNGLNHIKRFRVIANATRAGEAKKPVENIKFSVMESSFKVGDSRYKSQH